jgi:hypothetical protein
MGIAFAFPRGVAAADEAVGWVDVGDLSTWSHTNPAGLLEDYAYADGLHSFTMPTTAATADYAVNSGSNFTGPRYHIPLVDGDGEAVLGGDRFLLMVRITDLNAGASRQWAAMLGVCADGASTVTGTMLPAGISGGATSVGTPNGGAYVKNFAATASVASGTIVTGSVQCSGSPLRYIVGAQVAIQSTVNTAMNQRPGSDMFPGSDSTPLSLIVLITSLGTVATTAGVLSMKMSYRVVRY